MGLRLAGSVLPWKEIALLALVSHLFSGGVTVKLHYGVDILYLNLSCTQSFPIG